MMRSFNVVVAPSSFTATLAYPQDISGNWQATPKAGGQELSILLQIAKGNNGRWRATMLSIDQSPDRGAGTPTTSFSLNGSTIPFAIDPVRGRYDGTLSADGTSLSGTWTQGRPLLLEFSEDADAQSMGSRKRALEVDGIFQRSL